MKERDATPHVVERFAFTLGETRPIAIHTARYDRPMRTPRFDLHYELEIGMLLTGRARRFSTGWEKAMEPGDLWFCGLWEPHGFQVLTAPCRALVFVVWPPFLAHVRFTETPDQPWMAPFLVPPASRPRLSAHRRGEALALARRVLRLVQADTPETRIRLNLLTIEMMTLGLTDWRPPTGVGIPKDVGHLTPVFQRLLGGDRFMSLAEAARICGIGPAAFARRFRMLMGVSFPRFALQHRLHGAARDLARTDEPLKAIAAAWGFTDACHLHRHFTRHYGRTPARYRGLFQGGMSSVPPRDAGCTPRRAVTGSRLRPPHPPRRKS